MYPPPFSLERIYPDDVAGNPKSAPFEFQPDGARLGKINDIVATFRTKGDVSRRCSIVVHGTCVALKLSDTDNCRQLVSVMLHVARSPKVNTK